MAYARTEIPEGYARARAQRNGIDAAAVVPIGLDALRTRLDEFIAVGFSKLVVVPVEPVTSWSQELDELADSLLELQRV